LTILFGPLAFQRARGVYLWVYAIAGVFWLRVILFAAFRRFCPIAAIASWA
jgi:hypothetical protein